MATATQSEYIRHKNKSALTKRWVATILLKSDLESHLTFSNLDKVITSGFDTSTLTKENLQSPPFIRAWLSTELERCGNERFDETDTFAINTQQIRKSMGLNSVELDVLRFACLISCYKPLGAAAEIGCETYTEADVCDLLSELLRKPFSLIDRALQPSGLLRQSALVQPADSWAGSQPLERWLTIPAMLAREIFRVQDVGDLLIDVFYKTGPKSALKLYDFPQRSELILLKKYLRASIKEGAVGANILLWGPPGTGKTEMARHIAQSLRKRSLEISNIGCENQALTATDRLDCYRFCQAILARSSNALVTFDEVEDVLCDGNYSRWGYKASGKFSKSMMNTILETNKTPAIWITNTVEGIDPAYLRRFDFVVNVKTPKAGVKERMVWRAFKNLPIEKGMVDRIVGHNAITPAHMQKVSKICERIGATTSDEVSHVACQILNGDLKAVSEPPLETRRQGEKQRIELPYRPELINCNADIEQLAGSLRPDSSVRICSFGPPGTGKTAWASHLAKKIRRPLLVKHAADILDKYVGETEKNIARVFRQATSTNSVLMLDEMDSFLPDRTIATRSWEVTQANQFLTAMEEYAGILICSTNLMDNLDPATMRRFDFKINFEYLLPDQACAVALDLLEMLKVRTTKEERGRLRACLTEMKLSHGDFAVLLRRYSVLSSRPGWEQVVADLKLETSFREKGLSRPIGFLAAL